MCPDSLAENVNCGKFWGTESHSRPNYELLLAFPKMVADIFRTFNGEFTPLKTKGISFSAFYYFHPDIYGGSSMMFFQTDIRPKRTLTIGCRY